MSPPARTERALAAAVALGAEHGLAPGDPVVLRDRHNVVVHLRPAPVVVRVAVAGVAVARGTAWLAREVAVAGHLARAGAPVVPPSAELPPGPHVRDGFALTAWAHVAAAGPVAPAAAGRALAACHAALRTFPGALPRWAVLDEAAALAARVAPDLVADVAAARARVDALGLPDQAVHGDAHLGNVIPAAGGPRWSDLEDAFLGPAAWDLACLRAFDPDRAAVAAAEAGYGERPPDGVLAPLVAARRLQGVVWLAALAAERPELRPRAAALLAAHRAGRTGGADGEG